VVWTLTLQPESEGPSLISYAARLLSGGHCGLLSAPSWRTVICKPAVSKGLQARIRTTHPLQNYVLSLLLGKTDPQICVRSDFIRISVQDHQNPRRC